MRTRHGIFWGILAVFLFSGMSVLVKWLSARYAVTQIAFCRAFFALIPVLPLFLMHSRTVSWRPRDPWGHVVRGLVGMAGMSLVFYGVGRLPLADSAAIAFTVPLWVTALARPFLGERSDARAWTAIAVGFAGVLVIVPPTGGAPVVPALAALLGNGLIGLAIVLVRRLGRLDPTPMIVFYYTLSLIAGTAVMAPLDWRQPTIVDGLLLAGLGVVGGTAHLVMTHAYRLAPAAVVAPFDYTGIVWAVLFGALVWGDWPGRNLYAGATLVIGSGLYILWRETRRDRGATRTLTAPAPPG